MDSKESEEIIMSQKESNEITIGVLRIIAEELRKGAAGPLDYWFKVLGQRLDERISWMMRLAEVSS